MSAAPGHRTRPAAPSGAGPAEDRSPARPAPRRRRSLRLVRPAPKRRRRTTPFLLLSAILVGSLVVGIVTLQALVSQTSFRMQDLQARNRILQQDYGERTLTVARLSAPDRIAGAARRAGFVLPDPSHIYTLHVAGPRDAGAGAQGADSAPGSSALKAFLGAQP